ncbi:MAG: UDP-N-acetylmuramate dehydrogenase [Corynebacterium sp.]|nr:UDP-N-acetylmuramate dehydrogenase [Corynebacterium sp.]
MDSALATQLTAIPDVTLDKDVTFAQLTTLHLGGRPRVSVRCATPVAAANTISLLDTANVPLLVVGGGSNLVVADGEIDLVAVILECDNVAIDRARGTVRVEAGAVWDEVVALTVESGLGGIECLSGIPGSAGATPVQNVGAYGVEIADVLTRVRLWDRERGVDEWVDASALELSYRYSNLKFTGRAVVLEVELALAVDGLSAPLRFGELVRVLGVEAGARVPAQEVRDAVLALRRAKGMVHDPSDHDTWSAGSFFTNPIVPAESASHVRSVAEDLGVTEGMPCFEVEGGWKLSAAWLIDKAGFTKGYPGEGAAARLSTKHTLALTNRGNATAEDLAALAREVRAGVDRFFGVVLEPEPVWVGMHIDT